MINFNKSFAPVILGFFLVGLFLSEQNKVNSFYETSFVKRDSLEYCASTLMNEAKFDENPELERLHNRLENSVYEYLKNNASASRMPPNYTLPVVVHIIHNNGSENISDAAILQGISHLNESFENIGYYDQGTGVDTQIQFCLAERDPDGNTTNGITRDVSTLTDMIMETEDIAVKDINRWDPLNYINIWLVREICSNSIGCGVAGYAYFPSSHGSTNDGIMMEADFFGSSNSASTVLTHEMGHYLGLYHTFQGGCPNDDCLLDGDRVCDTPPDQSTAAVPCNATVNTCSTDVNASDPNNPFITDQNDMFWNYMDYGDFGCYSAFTAGQTERMNFFIEGARASLLASEACMPACESTISASFNTSINPVEIGSPVNFTNTSTGGTNYQWLVDGIPFSTTTNSDYTFNAEGFYIITLEVTNADPNCFESFSDTIQVVCPVLADFTASSALAGVNEVVSFSNNSTNATNYEWFLNGESQGNATTFSFSLTTASVVQVCLEASSTICENTHCEYISIISNTAADCDLTYVKTLGENFTNTSARTIIPIGNGEFFIGGSRQDSAMIMRVNADGNPIWTRTFKFTNNEEAIYDMILDADNRIVAVGYGNPSMNTECFAFKYNHIIDDVEWGRAMPTNGQSRFWGVVEKGPTDDYIVVGQTIASGGQGLGCDAFVMDLERNSGNVNWMRNYNLGSCESSVEVLIDNATILVTGRFNNAGGGTSQMRGSLTRLDFSGNELWSRLYLEPTNTTARIYSNSIVVDEGKIISISQGDDNGTSTTDVELHIYATDLDGTIDWAEKIDVIGVNVQSERTTSLVNLPDGYLIYGHFSISGDNQLLLIKTNKQGQVQWSRMYGDSQGQLSRDIMLQDGFIHLLGTYDNSAGNGQEILLAKLNMEGELTEPCDFIQDLTVSQSTINNPYDGLHPLTVFNPALSTNNLQGESAMESNANASEICSASDCCVNQTYVKALGDSNSNEGGTTIIPSGDGNLFLTGFKGTSALIIKMSPAGDPIWTRSFKFTNNLSDRISSMKLDSDNNLIGCGSGTISGLRGFVFKYDFLNDNMLWVQILSSDTRVYDVFETSPGGDYIITADLNSNTVSGTGNDASLFILNRNTGNPTSTISQDYSYGSSETFSSAITLNNALYTFGRYTEGNSLAGMRASLSRFDFNGNEQWSNLSFVPTSSNARIYGRDIIEDDGDLVLTISGDDNGTSATASNFFLQKTDLNGSIEWVKKYNIPIYGNEWVEELIAVSDGYIMMGYNRSGNRKLFLVKTDKDGEAIWAKQYGGTGIETISFLPQSQLIEFDGYLYFTGESTSFGNASYDALLIRTDLNGDVDQDCEYVVDLEIETVDVSNFSNESMNLIAYNSGISMASTSVSSNNTTLQDSSYCISSCLEICNNGIDDDGDDLIDFYDPDCPCLDPITCGSPFYNVCPPECEFPIPAVPFEMERIWTKSGVKTRNGQVVADINGDCVPDIVVFSNNGTSLDVLDSENGTTLYTIAVNIPASYTHPALGDIDNDGMAEIFYTNGVNGAARLVRIDYVPGINSLVQNWVSSTSINSSPLISAYEYTPALADFDYNGISEVYIGNQIFHSQTGLELLDGGLNNQGVYNLGLNTDVTSTSVAADMLSDSDCAFCHGLELVAGGEVYTVNIASYTNPSLNSITIEKTYNDPVLGVLDGLTRIVDFDKDGDLDVVVTTQLESPSGSRIFVWDVLTENLIGNVFADLPNEGTERIGAATIADVDNDGWPEIIVATTLNLTVLEDYQNGGGVNWGADLSTIKASVSTLDNFGISASTIFDLNGDGFAEIIFKDGNTISVFDGELNVLASIGCPLSWGMAYPVIADINADGETELLCGCSTLGLSAIKPVDLPWIKSRKIWNQYNYFVTNVHDDGTIPIQQQSPHRVGDGAIMNNFLTQQPILDSEGTPINLVPDGVVQIDSAFCYNDSINVYLNVCNEGDYPLTETTPLTVYIGDPTSSTPEVVTTFLLGQNLAVDSCVNLLIAIPNAVNEQIFVVLNDNGSGDFPYSLGDDFPVTSIGECDFQNNIGDVTVFGEIPPPLDLGPDIIVCENGVFEFDAGAGFDNYQWQDGSTDSTFTSWNEGVFWVTAWNECGPLQTDTVQLTIDTATIFDLGLDTVLCGGSALTLSVPGYDRYEWFPNIDIDCDSCETVVVDPSMPTTYTLVASTDEGCVSVDSIMVTLADTFYTEIDTVICDGETFIYNGDTLQSSSSTYFTLSSIDGCDSTVLVNVTSNGLPSFYFEVDTFSCFGTPLIYDGVAIEADSTFVFEYQTIDGCDSTIVVYVNPLDTFYTVQNESICEGESILIFGNLENTSGEYSMTYTASNGCDSTSVFILEVFDNPELTLNGMPTCVNDSTGSITVSILGGAGPFDYDWNFPTSDTDELQTLPVGTYTLSITDDNNCGDTATLMITDIMESPVTASILEVSCFGENDGLIVIDSMFGNYLFSLDGQFYQNTLSFGNLFAGSYDLYVQDNNGCEFIQNFTVPEPPPLIVALPQDTVLQIGCAIEIEALVNRFDSLTYSWSPDIALDCINCPVVNANPLDAIEYTVTVIDSSGCVSEDQMWIRVSKKRNIFIPNVFSPNFDGTNDLFMIYGGKGVAEIIQFTVFDRWGEQLFEHRNFQPNDPAYGWNGMFKNKEMNPGVFVYYAEVLFVDGETRFYKGSVNLVK